MLKLEIKGCWARLTRRARRSAFLSESSAVAARARRPRGDQDRGGKFDHPGGRASDGGALRMRVRSRRLGCSCGPSCGWQDLAHPSWAPATNAASSRSMAASSRRRLGEPRVGSSVPSRLGAPRQALPRPPCPACRVSSRCSCCPLGPCLPCGACARCRGAAQVLFAGRSPQFGAERLDSSPPSSWCGA